MRTPLIRCLLLSLMIASSASAVTMAWTSIGDPGNSADTEVMNDGTTGYGSVPYAYSIGTYEVTNAQYAEFLNAKAASDPLHLYNERMGDPSTGPSGNYGGITRAGSPGSYSYSAIAGREDLPVNYTSFIDALRFANWMNNGQGNADTETGSYILLGGTEIPSNYQTVTRTGGAVIALSSEDEWYKAAFYDATLSSFFDYPTGTDAQTVCATPTGTANRANCNNVVGDMTSGGSYTGSASPYGTFDQGGNVYEWNETLKAIDSSRGIRGGDFYEAPGAPLLASSVRGSLGADREFRNLGFRLAMIPEPGTGLLVVAGLLGLAGWRKVRA